MTRTQMTPKERRDAQIELRDMAYEMEHSRKNEDLDSRNNRFTKAQFLRAVANELDHVPEVQ